MCRRRPAAALMLRHDWDVRVHQPAVWPVSRSCTDGKAPAASRGYHYGHPLLGRPDAWHPDRAPGRSDPRAGARHTPCSCNTCYQTDRTNRVSLESVMPSVENSGELHANYTTWAQTRPIGGGGCHRRGAPAHLHAGKGAQQLRAEHACVGIVAAQQRLHLQHAPLAVSTTGKRTESAPWGHSGMSACASTGQALESSKGSKTWGASFACSAAASNRTIPCPNLP